LKEKLDQLCPIPINIKLGATTVASIIGHRKSNVSVCFHHPAIATIASLLYHLSSLQTLLT